MMTLKEAKRLARGYGCSLRKTEDGEYRVCLRADPEETAYCTDDIEDAVNTALAMYRDYSRKPRT